ncbi:hypothetical protein CTRI78_v010660 [Colletotrichum trifolii]|uniref:Heterokaryon incompatibility domain-containing protein n=1 Tax=Colletotrichum trifolii TaxID=5466 RepID=A0A4R8QT40_COLTR|nr:hypothetical protein CTRI78_v010660 [Colletotrichum trifolii]
MDTCYGTGNPLPGHHCQHCERFTIYVYDEFSDETLMPGRPMYKNVPYNPSQLRVIEQCAVDNVYTDVDFRKRFELTLSGCSFFEASRQDMEAFAKDGCLLAQHIVRRLTQPLNPRPGLNLAWAYRPPPRKYALGIRRLLPGCMVFGYLDIQRVKWHEMAGINNLQRVVDLPSAYTPLAMRDDPASRFVEYYPINRDPASRETASRVQKRLHECLQGHRGCIKPKADYMPTRLIEVRQQGEATVCRLRERPSDVEPYCALSYCWGGDQTFKTTSKTLHSYYKQLPNNLPQTLLDAIRITKQLSVRYIWIDALCIIQDSDADRGFEIGHMAHVYSNATITIAATRAAAVWEGFLGLRPPLGNKDHNYTLPAQMVNGDMGTVTLVPGRSEKCEPLDTRGWCFQERLLSPRVLDFGSLRTVFNCRESTLSDGWSDRAPDTAYGEALDLTSLEMGRLLTGITDGWELQSAWLKVVTTFVGRDLTWFEDKLPAMAGLAESFGRSIGDKYCAGLWLGSMPASLLWKGAKTKAPRLCNAVPSWSWGSVPGAVWSLSLDPGVEMDATADDCMIDLDDPRVPYGSIRSARLTITAYARQAQWLRATVDDFFTSDVLLLPAEPPGKAEENETSSSADDVSNLVNNLDIRFQADASGEWAMDALKAVTNVRLVCLGTSTLSQDPKLLGLVVMTTDDCEDVFVRVGTFLCEGRRNVSNCQRWFQAAKREELVVG